LLLIWREIKDHIKPHYNTVRQKAFEVYLGESPRLDVHKRIKQSAKKRVQKNKNSSCKTCAKLLDSGSCINLAKG
jgi:hypothetical protein